MLSLILFSSCNKDNIDTLEIASEQQIYKKEKSSGIPSFISNISNKDNNAKNNVNTASYLTTYLNLINPNDVIVIEDENGVKNYTFTLDLVEEGKLTNLVVQDNNGSYTYNLIEYTADDMAQWLDDVYVNESTLNSATASVTDLGKVEVMTCPTFDYICPSGYHGSGQVGSCTYLLSEWSITMVNGDCNSRDGGGSSSNPSGGGGSSNPVIITSPTKAIQPWEEVLACLSGIGFNGEIAWLQDNKRGAGQILNYLKENECSAESQNEAVDLIESLMNPYIDIDYDLIDVDNLNNDCAKNIITEEIIGNVQVGTNANFINKLRNLFSNDTSVDLLFRNGNIPAVNDAVASTDFDTDADILIGQYKIIISLDNAYLNSNPTKLHLALTMLYEMLHAELMYYYLHGTLLSKYPNYTDLNTAMETFLINRNATNAEALNDAMHIAMVDFIGTMSYSLFKYAENAGMSNITEQYCKDIIKRSFYKTPAMPLINTGNQTPEALNNKVAYEKNNTTNAQGDDC